MKEDYTYCINEKQDCIHRRGCSRWIGNFTEKEILEKLDDVVKTSFIDESKCIPNYKDKDCENKFDFLDRFRLSDGSKFE